VTEACNERDSDIAIIGMAGRFPKARNLEEFWANLLQGRDCVTFFTEEELAVAGVRDSELRRPGYVRANQVLDDVEGFDADLFAVNRQEAELIDPQQRLLLECAHEALEDAGYDPRRYRGSVGVYAGAGMNTYLLHNLQQRYREASSVGHYQLLLASDKDFLATRISYKLDLKGPSLSINSACSTSLVAVHVACLGLLSGECDMALAGSVSIRVPQVCGYEFQEGMIFSPDGHCRAFDQSAAGTLLGNGLGVVVLKRLTDAIADRDTVRAVVRGSAINNDGSLKAGYTAPGVEGQAAVITDALDVAGVSADSISYVEAHGTGTPLGDPVEVAALTLAHRKHSSARQYCAIGSVKTNIGHLDTAAGMAGLIKTVLMLEHRTLVPSLHFERPNSGIDFASSPFFVQTQMNPWPQRGGAPRRAGVSAFGIGGTNAHVILEEAPATGRTRASARPELIVISARSESQLDETTGSLARHLRRHSDTALCDVAYTLACGRQHHAYRRIVVGKDARDVSLSLALAEGERVRTRMAPVTGAKVSFIFADGSPEQHLRTRHENQVEISNFLRSVGVIPDGLVTNPERVLVALEVSGERIPLPAQISKDSGSDALVECLDLLGRLWLHGIEIDWEGYFGARAGRVPLPTYPFRRQRCWVETGERSGEVAAAERRSPLVTELGAAHGAASRVRVLAGHLQRQVGAILGLSDEALPDPDRSFMELKLESLTLIEIVARLSSDLGLSIPSSALIEYPTIAAFSKRVIELLSGVPGVLPGSAAEAAEPAEPLDTRRAALEEQRRRRRGIRASNVGV